MPSKLITSLLSAVMLAALLQCAAGAPVEDALADSPAGETSGEEGERPSDLLSASQVWECFLGSARRHKEEFDSEFHNEVQFTFLKNYKISSLPESCPKSNLSKEASLHRLAQGLLTYTVLLKHVEKEYPNSQIASEDRYNSGLLIGRIKEEMRNPDQVTVLSSSQEEQLLRDIDSTDTFQRKMTAHSILHEFHDFLFDCKRAIKKREKPRGIWPMGVWHPTGSISSSIQNQL